MATVTVEEIQVKLDETNARIAAYNLEKDLADAKIAEALQAKDDFEQLIAAATP